MAAAGERSTAFVAEPHARGSDGRQQSSLVEPLSPYFRDITNGVIQCRVIIEEDRRPRGEPLESIACANESATARGKPRVVNCLQPRRAADAGRIVGRAAQRPRSSRPAPAAR
jgi:hypothetical protein